MDGLIIIAGTVAYLYAFWAFYVLVMGLYRAHLSDRLKGVNKALATPVIAVGYGMDVLCNMIIATVLFVELPQELLVTTRLTRYTKGSDWRSSIAIAICDKLLDPFDPTGNHC